MKRVTLSALSVLLMAGAAHAQAPKVSGLVQAWYTQMADSNLRNSSSSIKPNRYYNLRSEFTENGFHIRRTELKVAGKVMDEVEYEVMFDPSIGTGSSNILQDAALKYKLGGGFEIKVGQFKNLQGHEAATSSSEILLAERSMFNRTYGDFRDRGLSLGYAFGDKAFGGKLQAGVFNGQSKTADLNAQKDLVLRADFNLGATVKFGAYSLMGSTDQANSDKAPLAARTFAGTAPKASEILEHRDETQQFGAFAQFQDDVWYASAEVVTGTLGRRAASLGSGAAAREHLDQKFLGFTATGAYTTGNHSFLARFDQMNYNSGDQWYTATHPYKLSTGDYTPTYTEITAGYTYAFKPEKLKAANLKLNYIMRSKNFLLPRVGQTGEQGGDSLVLAFQVAF